MRTVNFLLVSLFACMSAAACAGGDESDSEGSALRLSRKGESCGSTPECETGLACVDEVCLPEELGLEPTGKECVAVQCVAAEDCCQLNMPDPVTCESYQQQCDQGDQFYCQLYQDNCVCDANRWSCTDDQCRFSSPCTSDIDCPGVCEVGSCVECRADTDCVGGACVGNVCAQQSLCDSDSDCAYFHACQDQQCVETGCTTNRECIEFTDDPLAFCEAGDCRVQCATDAECIEMQGGLQTCVSGFCEDAGCETDEECRIALGLPPGTGMKGVCRPEAQP